MYSKTCQKNRLFLSRKLISLLFFSSNSHLFAETLNASFIASSNGAKKNCGMGFLHIADGTPGWSALGLTSHLLYYLVLRTENKTSCVNSLVELRTVDEFLHIADGTPGWSALGLTSHLLYYLVLRTENKTSCVNFSSGAKKELWMGFSISLTELLAEMH